MYQSVDFGDWLVQFDQDITAYDFSSSVLNVGGVDCSFDGAFSGDGTQVGFGLGPDTDPGQAWSLESPPAGVDAQTGTTVLPPFWRNVLSVTRVDATHVDVALDGPPMGVSGIIPSNFEVNSVPAFAVADQGGNVFRFRNVASWAVSPGDPWASVFPFGSTVTLPITAYGVFPATGAVA